ncbi:MAG: amidohydrolase [Actinobacteria bacterium]|nr:amidohydrolase [Actinomycetota bacterium]
MKEIEFFDLNFWVGENRLDEKSSLDDDKLSWILDDRNKLFRISSTLVTHFLSLYYYPMEGNKILSKSLDKNRGIFGALALEQEYICEGKKFEEYLTEKFKEGFRIIRLFPKSHKYSIAKSMLREIYEVLNDHNFPIMVSIDELDITGNKNIEWEKLLEVAESYRNIPIIIDGGSSKELQFNSYIFPMLKYTNNIHLDTHNLLAFNQIEDISSLFGSKRLLYGSYFPFINTHLTTNRILYSDLKTQEKNDIANLNTKKILNNIELD